VHKILTLAHICGRSLYIHHDLD